MAKLMDEIKYDAGFIKSGLLEAMAKEGKVSMDNFEIVDKQDDGFAHVHSTILYPEWYMSAGPEVDGDSKAKLKSALLKLKTSDKAASNAKIVGFVEPLSLDELTATLKALKLPPYDK